MLVLVLVWTGSVCWSCMEASFLNKGKQKKKCCKLKALSTTLLLSCFMKVGNPSMAMAHKIINTLYLLQHNLSPHPHCIRRIWNPKFLPENSLPAILDLCLRKTQPGKSHECCDTMVFKLCFQNVFRLWKWKAGIFKFLQFEEHKAQFLIWISVDGRSKRRKKSTFSNFSGVVPMPPRTPVFLFI